MSAHFSRRQVIAGAASGTALIAAQAASAGPAQAAQAVDPVRAPQAALPAQAGIPVRAATRSATFPVGYSTGSSLLFESKTNIAKTLDLIVSSGGTTVRFDIMWEIGRAHV